MRRLSAILVFLLALLTTTVYGAATAGNTADILARGRYLTRLGDCQACHTQPGHPAFSGGLPIETPFGVFYTPNITPDRVTGIGNWSADDFYRAMHQGIGPDGEYLYPVFPFPAYTKLSREDVKAIWTYLRSVEPVRRHNRAHTLRWPYSMRSTLKFWRLAFFRPGPFKPAPDHPDLWNRGAYLVTGLTHCGACHTPRNRWGARIGTQALAGGTVPIDGWHAPNITPNPVSGIGGWTASTLKSFLKTGRSSRGHALGPMRDVVQSSLQYLKDRDLRAIVTYLQSVPEHGPRQTPRPFADAQPPAAGKALYNKHCATCHGDDGRGKHPFYPDLRDNPVVLAPDPTNLVLIMLRGGFQASTEASPYPYSMPPFGFRLDDVQISAIANYLRYDWGHRTPAPVGPHQVSALR